jgi:hypothetical protein
VLIVGHQAKQVDVFRDGRDVVCAAPVCVNPFREPARAGEAGSIGHRGDGQLQTGFVQRFGGGFYHVGQSVAVDPIDILEIELESGVAVQFAFADHRLVHLRLRDGIPCEQVELLLVEERNDRHDRHLFLLRSFEHHGIGSAGDQTVLVYSVPRGHQQIDLRRMRQEGTNGVWTAGHVEKRHGGRRL